MTTPPPEQVDAALAAQMDKLREMVPASDAALAEHREVEQGGAFKKLLAEAALPALTLARVLAGPVREDGAFAAQAAKRAVIRAKLAEPPALLVLGGPSSLGKTFMAVVEAVEFLKKARRVRYVRLFDLMEIYDAARNFHATKGETLVEFGSEREVSLWLQQPQLLIVDECDKCRESRYVLDKVFNVAEARREARRSTMFVGNWSQAEFAAWAGMNGAVAHGPSLVNRINRSGAFVRCDWGALTDGNESSSETARQRGVVCN